MGLEARISGLRWDESQLRHTFALTFHDRSQWALNSIESAQYIFWDGNSHRLDTDCAFQLYFDEDFHFGRRDYYQMNCRVSVPEGAEYLAVELGQTGLRTSRIRIPQRTGGTQ